MLIMLFVVVETVMAGKSDWDVKHNICAYLDVESQYSTKFRDIIRFLNRSRILTTITIRRMPYLSHIRSFWDNAQVDCTQEPPVIRSVVKEKPIVISEQLIRETLGFHDTPDMPLRLNDRLVKGCLKCMKYSGNINDKQVLRANFSVQWKYFLLVLVHCFAGKKGGFDVVPEDLQSAAVALILNKPFNFSGMIFNYMKMNLTRHEKKFKKFLMYPRFLQIMIDNAGLNLEKKDDDTMVLSHMDRLTLNRVMTYRGIPEGLRPKTKPVFGHVRNPDYVAPEGDAWRHPESNSETENMDDYVAYRAASDSDEPQVAPPPVAPRRRRPAPPKPKKSTQAEAESSTQREGKQVIQEGVVEDDDS